MGEMEVSQVVRSKRNLTNNFNKFAQMSERDSNTPTHTSTYDMRGNCEGGTFWPSSRTSLICLSAVTT